MADAQSSSSAEVEGYVAAQHQQQPQQQSVQFPPPPPPPDPTSISLNSTVNDKSSRWSTRDDVLLCDALISQKGMGRNTGAAVFAMDAWDTVADQMKGSEVLSGGAVKTVVQCKARWQRLKIEYRIVKHIRQLPGFQWDENTQMVTALAATWDAYIAEHKDAQPWRKKSFPCYSRVAYLIEDEKGYDPGDAKFKRRWAAHAQSAQSPSSQGGGEGSVSTNGTAEPAPAGTTPTPASSTSVFQVVPRVTMSIPLNGGYSAIHQYRLPTEQSNGKRAKSDAASASSKRPRSDANIVPSSQPQPEVHYAPQPVLGQPQPYPPPPGAAVYYTAPPPPGSAPVLPPPVPVPAQTNASRLALAIQSVEENESLADGDFVKAVRLFQRRMEAADAYLAIQSKRARALYLKAELEEFEKD